MKLIRLTTARYGAALLVAAVAVGLRWILDPWLQTQLPLVTFFSAVAVVIWYCGPLPAVLAAIVAYVAAHALFIGPQYAFALTPAALAGFCVYALSCALIILIGQHMRRIVREARDAARRAEQSEQRLQRIANGAPVALAEVDAERRLKFVNAEYAGRRGLRPADVIGRTVAEVVSSHAYAQIAPYMDRALRGEHVEFEVEVHDPRGAKQHLRCAYEPERDTGGQIIGYVAAVLNITDRKQAEEALRETAHRLAMADRRKDEFLATLAHELRNPLAPIRNAVHFLQLKELRDPDLQNARDMIDRQVRHMVRLVDDLLDISRVTLGQIPLQNETVSLGIIVTNAVEASRSLIDAGHHHLSVQLPEEPLYVEGDSTRLSQVFQNLLNNAAKYTPRAGRIELRAGRVGDQAQVSICDNGIGIRPDMLQRVFEMFTQIDRATERTQGGLGIGLALAQQLIQMHGGRIEAHSDGEGRGSEFTVTLPLSAAPVLSEPALSSMPKATGPRRRVLIVDDNIDAAESLTLTLGLHGHDARAAFDGEAALTIAADFRPEVVLLDIGMPKLDGIAVCRRIRNERWGRNITLVALTGWGQDEDRRRTMEAGFDHHLVKPADPALIAKILTEPAAAMPPAA